MKKILSVILAVMMLCGTMAISSSALDHEGFVVPNDFDKTQDVIIVLRFGSGKCQNYLTVYNQNTATYEQVTGVTGEFVLVGDNYVAGRPLELPYVTAAEGNNFNGWFCDKDGRSYPAGPQGGFVIPNFPGEVIVLTASYYPSEGEGDTMGTIIGILTKVFGAILGILLYGGDTEAGVAMMDKILGGLEL